MAKAGKPGGKGKGKGPVVGYGEKGKAFHDVKKYNQSESGQRHAKNPALSTKPVGKGVDGNVFFSKAKYTAAQNTRVGEPPSHQQPHTPMPGHPSQNPAHYHGPATTGRISGPKAPAAPRGGMPGMK
jgi:hypothetical protein